MKLSLDAIKQITIGAEYITENNGYIQFHRFNKAEEDYYKNAEYPRHYTTSGIELRFKTDSKRLKLKIRALEATPTNFFAHDIFVNGKKIGNIANFLEADLPIKFDNVSHFPIRKFPLGDFEGEFELGDGVKEVCIVFPWSVNSMVESLVIDDNATVSAVKNKDIIISYGDSITYGATAVYPSNRYMAKLARALGSDEICKAVGGEIFCPNLVTCASDCSPQYITVAYGTNDMYGNFEAFKTRCSAFFENISKVYPDSAVFAISPIWRTDCENEEGYKRLKNKENYIKEITAQYKNIKFISGYDLVPHNTEYFADLFLHPNDNGFEYYVANLLDNIRKK